MSGLLLVPVQVQAVSPSQQTGTSVADSDASARYVKRKIVNDCSRVVARPHHIDWCGNTSDRLLHLKWSSWGAHAARARGLVRINNCKPSCADGTSHRYGAEARLHRVVRVNGHPRFIRLTIRVLEGRYQGKTTLPLPRKPFN